MTNGLANSFSYIDCYFLWTTITTSILQSASFSTLYRTVETGNWFNSHQKTGIKKYIYGNSVLCPQNNTAFDETFNGNSPALIKNWGKLRTSCENLKFIHGLIHDM
ncbi:7530_t:CDS:2 [Ambispora leptoticha]|uniref:7530_t:CDS:1 n=1 Tax=Ambispora leptoticha TaxID=144679 RepID=A0A9N9BD07_9GLOM|nr:7530_t:CDS:2 [Ambispora leptoticha]